MCEMKNPGKPVRERDPHRADADGEKRKTRKTIRGQKRWRKRRRQRLITGAAKAQAGWISERSSVTL
jgi:hypothetical protein